jgi:hypothetical protein
MIDVGGVTTLPSKYKGKLYQLKFYMVDRKAPAILSAADVSSALRKNTGREVERH